jgi:hypothetical protein
LAFGIIGPPECCIVTGCDEHGNVLIGWNYFQSVSPSSAPSSRSPSWMRSTARLAKDTEAAEHIERALAK